jgi:predicted phosphoribosyltransferase
MVKEIPAVVALSPGGVRVASEIARAYGAPLDVRACLRLEVPGRAHSIFGAVADGEAILVPDRLRSLELPEEYVQGLVEITQREANQIARVWRDGVPALDVAGRIVLLVDDGLSDAVMVTVAAHALREAGVRRLIYMAPVATPELWAALSDYCDDRLLLYPAETAPSAMIGDPEFEQTTGFDVARMIRESRRSDSPAARRSDGLGGQAVGTVGRSAVPSL